ncbi:MAG: 3-isopropylmalate dehydratase large subunit [Rhodospirillaceae bacterium]|jgi:3-isopropylmalate/(R)-2-methylmalate dehydratase large subunit
MAKTLFDKIWDDHVITTRDDGEALLFIDRHYFHEGSFHAFDFIKQEGRGVRRPDLTFGFMDHYVPTLGTDVADPEIRNMIDLFQKNSAEHRLTHFDMGDPEQGIVHVVGPELGLTLPGVTLCCGDSHTSTHGAMGAFSFGIGASEVAHVLATQTLWQRKPKSMRVTVNGKLGFGVSAKDLILAIIAEIGAMGGTGHVIEYAGPAIEDLSVEGRLTLCNMTIEAGARSGIIAPDEKTFAYLEGRKYAPKGKAWDDAVIHWQTLKSDEDAVFDKEVTIDGNAVAPTVTWGTSPEEASPVTGSVPDPARVADTAQKAAMEKSLDYMGLTPGMKLQDVKVDRVFIGSCTNARMEDLRLAAAVLKDKKAKVPAMISPGSTAVKRQAEAEGLDKIFIDAGFEWRNSGCSMCVGINGDLVGAGERTASTNNRNFQGRQGKGARTHLVSPAMAAAAAITGCLTDVRTLMKEGV